MPRAVVLLPSTTYRAADFVRAAEALGVDLVVASEQPPPFDMGNRYLQIDCDDVDTAAESVASLGDDVPLDGIVAADDAGVVIAAMAATSLGLRANPPEAARATRDKLAMRDLLGRAEVPQPRWAPLEPGDDPGLVAATIGFPVVVKPRDRSASQGVIRADSPEELEAAVTRINSLGAEHLIMESYVPGDEVAVEGLLRGGELTVLAIFDKPDMGDGPYFPETIFVTPSRLHPDVLAECERVAAATVRGLGLANGPVHIELRADHTAVRVIEVAARSIGGLCSRSLNFGLMGTTLETLILRNALGLDKQELRREQVASGVLMIPTPATGRLVAVEGERETREIPGVTAIDLTIPIGEKVLAPPDGDRYLGFVFARAATPEDVEVALRRAREAMRILIE